MNRAIHDDELTGWLVCVCVVLHLGFMSQSSEFSECFFINDFDGGEVNWIHLSKLSLALL